MGEQEQYIITTATSPTVIQGKFFDLIHRKHVDAYGQQGADNIVKNVRSTYSSLLQQLATTENHNSLLVGKVQSGKTSNLELLTALAFDNGYNMLVILGGYDTDLLRQSTERFGQTFDSVSGEDFFDSTAPAVFTTNETTKESINLASLNPKTAKQLLLCKRPIIITCLKRSVAMKKTIRTLETLMEEIPDLRPFIIDDEGDQASLNVAKDKVREATATYAAIRHMKHVLQNPLYLSVTATPEANIFQYSLSVLSPKSIHLIQPGFGYNGASKYHLEDNSIVETVEAPSADCLFPDSLYDAICYFLVASAIKQKRSTSFRDSRTDMIIHSDRTVKEHKKIYSRVMEILQEINQAFIDEHPDYYLHRFYLCYDKYIIPELREQFPFSELVDTFRDVVENTGVILHNSKGKETKKNEQYKFHKIFIGGDLLQRGLTFKNLIVSYFTRFAKNGGNMDTTLQRARWFGYRSKYLDLCKIFTTDTIAQEFSNLADIEDDLWDQFEEVENGSKQIVDILISAENTKLKPTAKNKANYKKIDFRHRWIKQKFIVVDDELIQANNTYLEKLIADVDTWTPTNIGSNHNDFVTAQYAEFTHEQLVDLILSINSAFDREPLYRNPLLDSFGDSGAIVTLMWTPGEKARYRSIYNNSDQDRIKALHQGANTTNVEKLRYLGDKTVIIDPAKINIQIHHISPGITKDNRLGKDQYMFAIYLPKDKTYFVKDND